jgi:hypothetical protein
MMLIRIALAQVAILCGVALIAIPTPFMPATIVSLAVINAAISPRRVLAHSPVNAIARTILCLGLGWLLGGWLVTATAVGFHFGTAMVGGFSGFFAAYRKKKT